MHDVDKMFGIADRFSAEMIEDDNDDDDDLARLLCALIAVLHIALRERERQIVRNDAMECLRLH